MRGQSSFEAISLFATATIILSIFMIYFGSQISTQAEEREYLALRDVADTLRQEILIARQAGPGYTRSIEIPPRSGSKPIVFNLEYSDDPNVSSELTVSFIPPIKDTIEASRLLGPDVYGLFSAGKNRIKAYDGGIVVEPDPEKIDELLDAGLIELDDLPEAEIAFAYIEGPNVRLSDPIECEYGVSNEWAASGGLGRWIDAGFIATDPSNPGYTDCRELEASDPFFQPGDRILFDDIVDDVSTNPGFFRKGNHVSCIVRYIESNSPISSVCPSGTTSPGPQSDQRTATSENVTIVNSLPNIHVRPIPQNIGTNHDGRTVWTVELDVEITDVDAGDDQFNVSIVQDGTNAAFIDCSDQNDRCTDTGVGPFDLSFVYDAPWPEGENCGAMDDLSFRIKAIEADSTSELYTLEHVDISNELECPPESPDA